MPTSRFLFVFALAFGAGLMSPGSCPADVAPAMPHNMVLSGLDAFGDLVFVLYADGDMEKGFLLDPRTAGPSGEAQLPTELPPGKLSLLGVPRALVEKSKGVPDPTWLNQPSPGVVRVTGVIHHYPVQKSSARHQYRLDKTDEGVGVTLLNPDVLKPYPPEDWMVKKESPPPYLWMALAGAGVVIVLVGVVAVWGLKRRSAPDGPEA